MSLPALNRQRFYEEYRTRFGRLTQTQVSGLDFLLDQFAADPLLSDPNQIAYALATVKHESADTFQPIEEYGKGKGHKYGKVVERTNAEGKTVSVAYYGRGYVQVTWERNYELFGSRLGIDLVGKPELALTPTVAYQILSDGMRLGLFTGKKLSDYIRPHKVDNVGARRIINGTDRAEHIASLARDFAEILEEAAQPATMASPADAASSAVVTTGTDATAESADTAFADTTPSPPAPTANIETAAEVNVQPAAPLVPQTAAVQATDEGWLKKFKETGSGVWTAITGASVATITFIGTILGWAKDNPLVTGMVIASITVLGMYVVKIKARQKERAQDQEHELNMERLRIAADPSRLNAR